MILHLLLYASLECSQASALIDQIIKDNLLSEYEKTELILYVREATPSCWDANADWRNGLNNLILQEKPMATVTYRGVEYDTEEYNARVIAEADKQRNHDLMYRGIKVERKFASKS